MQAMVYFSILSVLLPVAALAQAARPLPAVSPNRPGRMVYANTVRTQAAVQLAINSAQANTVVRLAPGTYTLTRSLLIRAKQGLTLDGNGQVTLTGAIHTFVTLSGHLARLRLTGIRFVSTYNRAGPRIDGMLTTDQTVQGDGYEVDHCYFTAPGGNFNAICWVPVDGRAGQATNVHVFSHINIHHNTIERMGSCGIELLNQNLDLYRVRGLTIRFNTLKNCGLRGDYGMGISLSGAMDAVAVSDNTVVDCWPFGIEVINCRRVTLGTNRIRSSVAGAAGISINASKDENGRQVVSEQITVAGNTVSVRYSPVQVADVRGLRVVGNRLYNLNSTDLSNGANRMVRCSGGIFTKNTAISSSYNCLTINNSDNWRVYSNEFSNRPMTTGADSWQLIWLYGRGSHGNVIYGNRYEKNKALRNTQQMVWESDGATGNVIR